MHALEKTQLSLERDEETMGQATIRQHLTASISPTQLEYSDFRNAFQLHIERSPNWIQAHPPFSVYRHEAETLLPSKCSHIVGRFFLDVFEE